MDDLDVNILNNYIQNPTHPSGVNEIFVCVFDALGIMPMVLSTLIFPQGSKQGLPAAPFCASSAALGFGGLGPYLAFRAPPVESKTQADLAWVTRNILENKIFNILIVGLCVSTLVTTFTDSPAVSEMWSGYLDVAAQSKLVAVSSVDLVVLTIVGATLIPRDYRLRGGDEKTGNLIAVATTLLPVLGAALYCAVRPSLPEE